MATSFSFEELSEGSFEMDPLYLAGDAPNVVLPIEVPAISLHELKEMTNNFGPNTFIGKGSFGAVYHALLSNGREAAIKKLNATNQSEDEFLAQVSMASRLKHENFVQLLGYCVEGNKRVLAYEFASNGSLHDILHGKKGVKRAESGPVLSWPQRVKIAVGIAKGLEYLHTTSDPKIFHGNLNSSNVLLFDDDVAKIADFDLSNEIADTKSYDYVMTSQKIDDKADAYSFGVILLELLTGHKPLDHSVPRKQKDLVKWVIPKIDEDKVMECIDARIEGEYSPRDVQKMAALAGLCVQEEPAFRPNMTIMVRSLQPLLNFN